jgi:hypothetical protein
MESKIEPIAGSPSEKRLRLARYFIYPDERGGPYRSLSLKRTRQAGTDRQADWAVMVYSVPDFRSCVNGKSVPVRKKWSVVSGRWSGFRFGT